MKTNLPFNIESKSEIISGLNEAYQIVDQYISHLDPAAFTKNANGKWSPMQHLQHLILSSKAIPSVLKMSKIKLALMGKAKNGSRSFEELKAIYTQVLGTGQKAGPAFSPEPGESWTKEELLGNWRMIQHKFETRISTWDEKELDTYQVPHPALGKLTMREMLHFTIFHTYHHLDGMKI